MNILQSMRRLGQALSMGWGKSFENQAHQQNLIKKLYTKHGLEIRLTCSACPEQYDVFKDGEQVAYYRLRHGEFRVDYPDVMGETLLEEFPNGDGIFDDNERIPYLTKAMRKVMEKIELGDTMIVG